MAFSHAGLTELVFAQGSELKEIGKSAFSYNPLDGQLTIPSKVRDFFVLKRSVLFHPSVISQFSDDFRDFSARVESDRCMLLDFCPSDKSLPIIYICFLSFPFNLVSGAFS